MSADTRWGAYVEQRLTELERGDGDFTGLQHPTATTVQHARRVAAETFRDTTPTPSVVPTEEGDVAFAWHKNGMDAEIEVSETGAEFWVHDRVTGEVDSGPLTDREGVAWLLDRIADGKAA